MKNVISPKCQIVLSIMMYFGSMMVHVRTKAQSFSSRDRFLERLELGIQPGAVIYQGDLVGSRMGNYTKPSFSLGISASYQFSPWSSANLQFVSGRVAADESSYGSYHSIRNFKFSTPLNYVQGAVHLFPFAGQEKRWWDDARINRKRAITSFISLGAGLAYFNPTSSWENLDRTILNEERLRSGLADDSVRNHKTFAGFLTVGTGCKIRLADNMYFAPSIEWHRLFSDYLDGFHKSCDTKDDSFTSVAVAFSYYFFRSKKDKQDD